MRIGTWNLEGRWDQRHAELVAALDCDLLLLTEVVDRIAIHGMTVHLTALEMVAGRRWAAIAAAGPLVPLPDPHPATAMAAVGGLRVCSSVLPWGGCGATPPWIGSDTADRTDHAVRAIAAQAPDIWGGDWNHAMAGPEVAGSLAGRRHVIGTTEALGLQVPTGRSPHHLDGIFSIDHVAVPARWHVVDAEHHSAAVDGVRVSDHDAYVVEVDPVDA